MKTPKEKQKAIDEAKEAAKRLFDMTEEQRKVFGDIKTIGSPETLIDNDDGDEDDEDKS